eukprot:7367133-Prymnesium_polylepis.1
MEHEVIACQCVQWRLNGRVASEICTARPREDNMAIVRDVKVSHSVHQCVDNSRTAVLRTPAVNLNARYKAVADSDSRQARDTIALC